MNEIELWESEIAESNKSHFFEDAGRAISYLSESIALDAKLLDIETFTEMKKVQNGGILNNIKTKIEGLVRRFIEFVSKLLKKIKEKFGKKASDAKKKMREEQSNKVSNDTIDPSVHKKVQELFDNDKDAKDYVAGLFSVKVNNIKNETKEVQKKFKNLDSFAKDIVSKKSDELKKKVEDAKAEFEEVKNSENVFDFDKYFDKIEPSSLGNNIKDITKNINKYENNLDEGISAFEEYAEQLLKFSKELTNQAIFTNFKRRINYLEEGEEANIAADAIVDYFVILSKIYSQQRVIVQALTLILGQEKVTFNKVFNIYLDEAKKGGNNEA